MGRDNERLDRAELLQLHQQYAAEMQTSSDFAHRNLSFYVGLLSAILGALLAGLLSIDSGDLRVLWLLVGPGLVVWLAEVGYSTARVFYHRFIDAYFTLLNVQHMLRLDDPGWLSTEVANPRVFSAYGGFIAQWEGAIDWLEDHRTLSLEAAKRALLDSQLATPIDILSRRRAGPRGVRTVTLMDARMTMWHSNLQAFC
jgi:hypothetical protein